MCDREVNGKENEKKNILQHITPNVIIVFWSHSLLMWLPLAVALSVWGLLTCTMCTDPCTFTCSYHLEDYCHK